MGGELRKSRKQLAPLLAVRVVRLVVSDPRPNWFEASHRLCYIDLDGDALRCRLRDGRKQQERKSPQHSPCYISSGWSSHFRFESATFSTKTSNKKRLIPRRTTANKLKIQFYSCPFK